MEKGFSATRGVKGDFGHSAKILGAKGQEKFFLRFFEGSGVPPGGRGYPCFKPWWHLHPGLLFDQSKLVLRKGHYLEGVNISGSLLHKAEHTQQDGTLKRVQRLKKS